MKFINVLLFVSLLGVCAIEGEALPIKKLPKQKTLKGGVVPAPVKIAKPPISVKGAGAGVSTGLQSQPILTMSIPKIDNSTQSQKKVEEFIVDLKTRLTEEEKETLQFVDLQKQQHEIKSKNLSKLKTALDNLQKQINKINGQYSTTKKQQEQAEAEFKLISSNFNKALTFYKMTSTDIDQEKEFLDKVLVYIKNIRKC